MGPTRPRAPRAHPQPDACVEACEPRRLLVAVPLVPEFRVNTSTPFHQGVPAIAMHPDGAFIVAWHSGVIGEFLEVYARRYDAAGVPQGDEFLVNTTTEGMQGSPSVAMDADGDFVVAWFSTDASYNNRDVYARRYDSSGIPQGDEFLVNSHTPSHQTRPSVAMNAGGAFVVTWMSLGQDGPDYGVYAQRFSATGAAQGGEFRVNTYTPGRQWFPAVAMDAGGEFVITWESRDQDGSPYGIYAQRYDAVGAALGGESRVNTYTSSVQTMPAIAMSPGGAFVVAWEGVGEESPGTATDVYARRYDADAVPQGNQFRVNSVGPGPQGFVSAAMDPDGDCVIAWLSGLDYDIYAQRYNAAGFQQGGEFRVNAHTDDVQFFSAVAMDGNGDFVITWDSDGQDGSGFGVYAQRYGLFPIATTASFFFDRAPHYLAYSFDEDVSASLSTADLVIENLTIGQTIPSSDFSLTYFAPGNSATFSYTGSAGGIAGVLPDGDYRATLVAAGVTTPNGNPLPANVVSEFFFLQGDANHDRRVNLADFNILAANFGQSPRDFTQGDFDYSGHVNLADFNILASRFGNVVAPCGVVDGSWFDVVTPVQTRHLLEQLDELLG